MKHSILLIVGFLILCDTANAQYKINKTKYDYSSYTFQAGDRYNPTVAGLASFLIPGLGQMVSGEVGRGIVFLGGSLIGTSLLITAANMSVNDEAEGGDGTKGAGLAAIAGIATLAIDIVAIVDAVRVAKVNNLAWRDKQKTSFHLNPYIISQPNFMATGLSFKVNF